MAAGRDVAHVVGAVVARRPGPLKLPATDTHRDGPARTALLCCRPLELPNEVQREGSPHMPVTVRSVRQPRPGGPRALVQHPPFRSRKPDGPPYEVGGTPFLDLVSTRLRNNDQTPNPMSAPPTPMFGPLLSPTDRVSSDHMMRPAPAAKVSTPTAIHTAGFWPMGSYDNVVRLRMTGAGAGIRPERVERPRPRTSAHARWVSHSAA